MKKTALSILALALLLTLVCGSALAEGDITIKAAKAYSDAEMTHCIGTIPKYTSVSVEHYGTNASIKVNGVQCYVKSATLTQGVYKNDYTGTATLAKGAVVYQRPAISSKYAVNKKAAKVYVYAVKKGLALVRTKKGNYGFVSLSSLSNLNFVQ